MEFEVAAIFNAFITRTFAPKPLIAKALLEHERKIGCIQRTCEQIRKGELSNIGRKMDVSRFKQMIEGCASIFCDLALKHMHEQALSSAERHRLTKEAGRLDDIRDELQELSDEATSRLLVSRPGAVAR